MALGISFGSDDSGERLPYVKYDARAGRFFKDGADITMQFAAIFDLEQIEVGWIHFAEGTGPDKQLVRVGEPFPPRPGPNHKRGFRILVKLPQTLGGEVREISSNAACVIQAIDGLHDQFLAAPERAEGKLPVFKLTGSVPIKSGQSTNYMPQFALAKWIDRPSDLPLRAARPAAVNGNGGTRHVGPPAARPQAAPPAGPDTAF